MQGIEEDQPPFAGGLLDLLLTRPAELPRLPVALLSREQKAAELQRVAALEAMTAAYEAELVLGLADDTPDDLDPAPGTQGRGGGRGHRIPNCPGSVSSSPPSWPSS